MKRNLLQIITNSSKLKLPFALVWSHLQKYLAEWLWWEIWIFSHPKSPYRIFNTMYTCNFQCYLPCSSLIQSMLPLFTMKSLILWLLDFLYLSKVDWKYFGKVWVPGPPLQEIHNSSFTGKPLANHTLMAQQFEGGPNSSNYRYQYWQGFI